MSSYATAWAWDQEVKQNDKLLLLFLADNADRTGLGQNLLNIMNHAPIVCGAEPQSIKIWLGNLKKSDLVEETEEGGYRLKLDDERKPKRAAFELNLK